MSRGEFTGNRSGATVVSELSGCCREESLRLMEEADGHPIQ